VCMTSKTSYQLFFNHTKVSDSVSDIKNQLPINSKNCFVSITSVLGSLSNTVIGIFNISAVQKEMAYCSQLRLTRAVAGV
jgi:hypothetical protein